MKVISKRIARNEFVSRKNGVIPWLLNEWSVPCGYGEYSYDTYSSAVQKANELGLSSSMLEYKSKFVYKKDLNNYGLIVSDIILPQDVASKITDYTDFYVNIPDGNGGYFDLSNPTSSAHPHYERDENGKLTRKIISGGTEVKILTYATLNKWYTFFIEYKRTIYPYSSATDYYENRYEAKNDANKKIFDDLDKLFKARGGEYMFDWLNGYCFPNDGIGYLLKSYSNTSRTFTAFTEYADYFSTNDLLVLYNKTTGKKYELKIDSFTKTSDNGGKIICSLVIKEGEEVKDIVLNTGDEIELYSNEFECSTNSASYVIPILFTNSIDDLGEMTIFSSKWKDGVDYSNRLVDNKGTVVFEPCYKDSDGDIVTIEETYVINGSSQKGYKQNEFYENEFKENDWTNYTDFKVETNNSYFTAKDGTSEVTTYAFSPVNGNVIYNPSDDSCKEIVKYVVKRFVIINDELIDVISGNYVIPNYSGDCIADLAIKNGKAIPVIKDGPLEYAELNGKRFYAVKEGNKNKIYFLNSLCCEDEGSDVVSGKSYVIYDNNLFLANGNSISIGDYTYEIFYGYFIYDGITFFINSDLSVIIDEETKQRLGWRSVSSADSSSETVTIVHTLDIEQANKVTGYTESKLELLRRRKVNTDELGNELPGYIDFPIRTSSDTSHYNTAYDRCTLDLLYVSGQTSDLEYQKTLTGGTILYNGNYLEKIEIYHLGEVKRKVDEADCRPLIAKYFNGGEYYDPNKPVYCDITYYIGATLEYDEENSRYIPSPGRHKGVKYVETFSINKLIGNFFMSDNTTFPFFYYELKGNVGAERLDDFKDVKLINLSYFEMKIMTFGLSEGTRTSGNTFNEDYWEKNNGMIMSPVFRTEYNLFSATPQKEDDNIYIDRGVSAAFESHLKLLETHTLESLENYSNGYFKINEY